MNLDINCLAKQISYIPFYKSFSLSSSRELHAHTLPYHSLRGYFRFQKRNPPLSLSISDSFESSIINLTIETQTCLPRQIQPKPQSPPASLQLTFSHQPPSSTTSESSIFRTPRPPLPHRYPLQPPPNPQIPLRPLAFRLKHSSHFRRLCPIRY